MSKIKWGILVGVLALCGSLLLGCGSKAPSADEGKSQKIKIMCTTFPQYDWVREILKEDGDRFQVSLLVENGTDMHSFQPSTADIVHIGTADFLIYGGGESESWVEDVLKEAPNKEMKVLNLMEALGEHKVEEEMVEGMQGEAEEDSDELEYDEHIWLSLKNAEELTGQICEVIKELDPENSTAYEANCEDYIAKLLALDQDYENVIASAKKHVLVVADRFPFRYLVDDYQLKYYAAFVGCSAETEANFETITFLAEKVDENDLNAVCVIENSDQKIAETVIRNTKTQDQEILTLNSLQSVTKKELQEGYHYLDIMEENLNVLKRALN